VRRASTLDDDGAMTMVAIYVALPRARLIR